MGMSLGFPGKLGSGFIIMRGWFNILLLVLGFLTAPFSLFAQSHLHDGATPQMNGAMEGSIEQAKQLLQEGEDLKVRDDYGWTPLHRAWNRSDNSGMTHFLIDLGATWPRAVNGRLG